MTIKIRHLFFFLIISAFFPCQFSMAQSLTDVSNSAELDLKKAIADLNTLRTQIAAEKIPLASKIEKKQSSLIQLRSDAAKIQTAKDSKTIGLEDLRSDLKSWQEENAFLVNLFDEYSNRFKSDLNASEVDVYKSQLSALNNIHENNADTGLLQSQLSLIDAGFSRLRSALNGTIYEGKALTSDGIFTDGEFIRFGPNVYFQSSDKSISGIILNQDKDIPRLYSNIGSLSESLAGLLNGSLIAMPIDVTNGKALTMEVDSDTLLDHIGKGGIWIIPILLFAGLSTITAIIKIIQIYKIKLPQKGSLLSVLSSLKDGKNDKAIIAAEKIPYPVGNMLIQGITHYADPKELIEEAMYESVLDTQPKLEKFLPLIAISAATAPLLGLLGTVTGMINTFQLIALFGTGDAQALSSGISEALITTEFGLIVAIPALIIHALLSRRIQSIMSDMEKFAVIFVNGLPQNRV